MDEKKPDEKKPTEEKPTYTYKVIERTFKENQILKEGETFTSTEVYNSRALEAADELTAAAVKEMKKVHDAYYKKSAPISSEESLSLRETVADLKAQLGEALGALKQAAASKR